MSYPKGIGTPEGTVVYSGPEEIFNHAKPVLMAFGDTALFLGNEIGHASAFDVAGLTFSVSMMLGFLQGYIVWEGENLPAEGFLQNIKGFMPLMLEAVTDLSRRLQKKEYSADQATLEAWSVLPKELVSWCKDRGVDHSIADAYRGLMDRAIKAGKGQADFAYLYEVLTEGHSSPAVSHQATA
jgi:3-hydroxyisobutyrate dehydrogenase-like beta-hydroxyacid dehydrogenase